MKARVLRAAASLAGLQAQEPARAGVEFQVNTYTTDNQWIYSKTPVAVDGKGNFVVVRGSRHQEGPTYSYGVYSATCSA